MIRFVLTIFVLVSISACSPSYMTTSGAEFLSRGPTSDPDIAAAAAYEPDLRLPARIAVVQLVYGRATPIQAPLVEVAQPVLNTPRFGQMVPLNQLTLPSRYQQNPVGALRQAAAAQHADYLLVVSLDPTRNTAEALFVDVRSGYPYASVSADVPGTGIRNFWGGPSRSPARIARRANVMARALAPQLAQMFEGLAERAR